MWLFPLFLLACNPIETATADCQDVCAAMADDCDTLDTAACHDICDLVIAEIGADLRCLELASDLWECHALAEWQCLDSTDALGEAVDPEACAVEQTSWDTSGCVPA